MKDHEKALARAKAHANRFRNTPFEAFFPQLFAALYARQKQEQQEQRDRQAGHTKDGKVIRPVKG